MKYLHTKRPKIIYPLKGQLQDQVLIINLQKPNLGTQIRIAEAYGSEAGVGGSIEYRTGSIQMTTGKQVYDLAEFAASQSVAKNDIEVKEILLPIRPCNCKIF